MNFFLSSSATAWSALVSSFENSICTTRTNFKLVFFSADQFKEIEEVFVQITQKRGKYTDI